MNFSDMLKKKKNTDENLNPEPQQEQPEIVGEINEESADKSTVQDEHLSQQEEVEQAAAATSEEEKLKAEIAEWNNKYLRLYAEFDNFKRRTAKERVELLQTAGKDVIVDLLPVLDDFDRALKVMETATDVASVKEGVNLIHQKTKNILSQKGLKEMESKNMPFDVDLHEAVTSIPAPTDELKGKIVDELEKGYYLNDKVIRFAKVVVGA
ncbi:MAG TPA: nucleotide exchange factor GrpE [Daejeonella sp.]|nr:nucleotide exchange factor GrpE [Daejeonella sp.]